jgi:hypothetical protein
MILFWTNILKTILELTWIHWLGLTQVWSSQLSSSDLIESIFKPIWNETRLEPHSRSMGYHTNLLGMFNNYDLESKIENFKHVYFLKNMKLYIVSQIKEKFEETICYFWNKHNTIMEYLKIKKRFYNFGDKRP